MERTHLMTLDTPTDLRRFMQTCLTPRAGFPGRTVEELAKVMPPWLADKVGEHAPRIAAARIAAARAHADYVAALTDWLTPELSERAALTDSLEIQLTGGCGICDTEETELCAACGRCRCERHDTCTRPAAGAAQGAAQ